MTYTLDAEGAVELGREVLLHESQAVAKLAGELDSARFARAVELLLNCRGRVVVSGVGKSGHIGRKIAATLASTGTPAFFISFLAAALSPICSMTPEEGPINLRPSLSQALANPLFSDRKPKPG